MNIYNAKNNSMPEQVLENKENIELLNTQVEAVQEVANIAKITAINAQETADTAMHLYGNVVFENQEGIDVAIFNIKPNTHYKMLISATIITDDMGNYLETSSMQWIDVKTSNLENDFFPVFLVRKQSYLSTIITDKIYPYINGSGSAYDSILSSNGYVIFFKILEMEDIL